MIRGKRVLLAGFAALVAVCLSAQAQKSPAVRIRVTDNDYPPQYFRKADGTWTGIDVELARLLVQEAGLAPEFIPRPWSRALLEMKDGSLHIMTNVSRTDERSEFMHWIGPERYEEMALFVQKGDECIPIADLDEMVAAARRAGKKIGIQRDAFYGERFSERMEDTSFAEAFEYVSVSDANHRKLRAGRIFGFIESKVTVLYMIKADPGYSSLVLHGFVVNKEPVYFSISKRGVSADTLTRLEKAFAALQASGRFEEAARAFE